MSARRGAVAAALAALALCAPADAGALQLGLSDPVFDPGAAPATSDAYYERAGALGVGSVRITARWSAIAPARPAGNPRDPASPAYAFAPVDAAVRAASARGLRVLLLVAQAPPWAEGAGRQDVPAGAWRPDPAAFGDFMAAIAARYSGTFDPGDGSGPLPFVPGFQLWNEPNLTTYLAPQWSRRGGTFVASSPERYRALVNAAYPLIKAASPRARVVAAGTAPYGDPQAGGRRIAPARFWRLLLCQKGTRARPKVARCPQPVKLDVFAHHPYGVSDPLSVADWPDDVTLTELRQLAGIWRLAERTRRVLPAGTRPRWVTEFGWETKHDPEGKSQRLQALWMGQALFQIAAAGFDSAFWFHIVDDPPVPNWKRSVQAGLYTRSGRAKAAVAMYAFPVAAIARGRGRVTVFAIPPRDGSCRAQRRAGSRWTTVAAGRCRRGVPWTRAAGTGARASFRVTVGSQRSAAVSAGSAR